SGDAAGAVRLLRLAARSSLKTRRAAEAIVTAQRALAMNDSLESRLLLAEAQGDAGKGGDALQTIAAAREAFGDSATLRVSEGLLAFTLGNSEEAIRHFTEAIAADPAGARDARLWLGFLNQSTGKHEEALAQADAVLAVEPTHALAGLLRMDCLALLGRFSDLQAQVQQMSSQFAHFLNLGTSMAATLADPIARGRLIAALKVDPAAVPPPLIFALCEVLAMEGDVKAVEEWTAIAEKRFPETHELCEIKRAGALIFAQRPAEAAAKLSPLVAAGTDSWDAYFLLAACQTILKQGDDARALLARVAMFWPRLQDAVDDRFALSYVAENRAPDALAYLTEQAASRKLGPLARLTHAKLLVDAGQIDEALDMLDYILHIDDRAALPLTSAIEARHLYGMVQLPRDREQTAAAARTLEEWFKQPAGIQAAAGLYTVLLDEDSLRRLLRENPAADARTRSAIVEGLAKCITSRAPSQEDLFEALRLNPGRLELAVALSAPHLRKTDAKDLVDTMKRIEEIAPGLLAAWNELTFQVLATSAAGETERIRATTLQMGNSGVARIGFAKILGSLGKITAEMAHDEFSAVVAEHPELADNCASLESIMLIELGLLDRAAACLAPYLQQNDPPEMMIDAITTLYLAQKDRDSAIAFSRRVAERFPSKRRIAQERVVDLLIAGEKHDEALAMLATMEAEEPLPIGLLVSRANALGGLERFDEALAALPKDEDIRDLAGEERGMIIRTRGRWLRGAKRLTESIAAFESAKAASPRDPRIRFGLAKSLKAAERWGEAYEAMLDGVALAPSELTSFESELRELREKRG
ncbi:MAG: tetratricopeptide repeat protein, partial [Gemmatimonadota bacterium]|nr:tetratricopeptide repeat protein [Gemmatimonadota bacterium]